MTSILIPMAPPSTDPPCGFVPPTDGPCSPQVPQPTIGRIDGPATAGGPQSGPQQADDCMIDGTTRLTFQPCTPPTTTTVTIAVYMPSHASLPVTGSQIDVLLAATLALLALGGALVRLARRVA